MSENVALFVGYAAIWIVMGVYLFSLARRQSGLRRDVERLERELDRDRV